MVPNPCWQWYKSGMDISTLIKQVARGRHGAENLTMADAELAFAAMLRPDADPLQLGAFLIAQRMKGETSAELAGFVRAARNSIASFAEFTAPDCVDLPCYAGKRRAPHAYLAAALQARDAGIPVFVHGVSSIDERVSAGDVLQSAGVQRAATLQEAVPILQADGIVYVDLSDLCPDLFRLYQLRSRLGVRTFTNTVARLLNPMCCAGQLNGFFHTPYADYMANANVLLGQTRSLLFMGAEGEPELYADRQKLILKQQGDAISQVQFKEAGEEPYPRAGMELSLLQQQSLSLLAGQANAREDAVIRRMCEAFDWACHGEMPQTWQEESQYG